MEYYLFKGSESKLVNLRTAMTQSSRGLNSDPTILPASILGQFGFYGKEEVPPVNYVELSSYLTKSETHSACVNFKQRNIAGKGFDFHNQDFVAKYKDLKYKVNERGETLYSVIVKFVYTFVHLGQAYLEVVGNKKDFNLYNSAPQNFRAMLNDFGNKVMFYAYNWQQASPKFIKAGYDGSQYFRFLHSLGMPNDRSQFYGVPDWYSGIQSMNINYAIDTWIESFVNNSARFDFLLVTAGQPLNKEQEEKVKATLTSGKGVKNAGKGGYLSVDYDTKVEIIQLNNVNHKSFFDGKGEYIQQIIQSHGVSEHSAGFSKGGNSIAGNEAIGSLRKDSETYIMPTQIYIESSLNSLIYQITGIFPDIRFKRLDIVSDKEKAVIYDVMIQDKVIPPSYVTRVIYPDLTKEEIAELTTIREKETVEEKRKDFQEQPDSFDDTQNYERADRR